ncbi:PorV/PorQ family protein [bacterium]|nr:PorV/PorQ family protein [bacterium]
MLKRYILLAVCLLLLTTSSYSQVSKVGTAGAKFLSISVDPRGAAMGYAFTAVTGDIASLYWNPAGIAVPRRTEILFSDVEWFVDIRNNFAGFIMPLGNRNSTIGISLTALTMGEEEITTIEEPEGTGYYWNANSIALGVSYARWFTNEFSFGFTAKLIRESIWELSATGLAMDLGFLLYPDRFKRLTVGATMTNFGTNLQFTGISEKLFRDEWVTGTGDMEVEPVSASYALPLCVKLGLAYRILNGPGHNLTWAIDLAHPNDGPERFQTGAEYAWNDMFFVRGGFNYDPNLWEDRDSSLEGFAGGVGFKYSNYTFDYAAEDRGRLGFTHRFALKVGF